MTDPCICGDVPSLPKLQLGFIGGGINSAVGRAHFSAAQMDGRFELVAGCFSKVEQTNRESAKLYGISEARTYHSFDELIEQEKTQLDAIVILTPTSDHLRPLLAALQAGLPVICEKAMASSVEEAEMIRKTELNADGFLAVTYNYTGYPCLRELRSLITNGQLGKILHFTAEMPQEGFLRENHAGKCIQPQAWRLQDGPIPTVYLDLGAHLHQIVHYLTGLPPQSVSAFHTSYGHFPDIIDYVDASVEYSDGVHGRFFFGKSMLGHRNGLSLHIYGDKASALWVQTKPETLRFFGKQGRQEILDRGQEMPIADLGRYTRFKAGHPAGYIEAFANLYCDIHQSILDFRSTGKWQSEEVFGSELALAGLQFLNCMADSARKKQHLNL